MKRRSRASQAAQAVKDQKAKPTETKTVTPTKKPLKKPSKAQKKPDGMSALVGQIEGILGKHTVHQGHDNVLGTPKMFIPSGVPDLDEVLDREGRGMPTGRIVEAYGAPASCKTGFAYALIAQTHLAGGKAVIFPSEGNVDTWLLEQYGVDFDRLIIADSNVVEDVFKVINLMVKVQPDDEPLIVVIDSVAGLCTKEELNNDDFDKDRSAQVRALLISKALRKLGALVPRKNVILYLINQVRDGGTTPSGVKSKSKPPGGQAIGFYCSIRLRLELGNKKWKQSKGKKYVAGVALKVTAEKNRLARPFQTCDLFLDFSEGLKSTG